MSIYRSFTFRFLGDIIPKNQPSNDLTMAGFELEMSSSAPLGGLARCGLLFRLQIGFGPCVRHDTPDALNDRRERLVWLGN